MANQQEHLKTILSSLGLSLKEAAVYTAILELGRGTVSHISRKAGINRTTGYDILDSLAGEGLVRISGKEPKQEYVAESPDNLIAMLERRREESSERINKAKEFLPTLKSVHKVETRPQIKFYEGIEGMKQVYEDTLTSTEPIVAYAAYEDMHATLGDYFPRYYLRRAAKGISVRGIVPLTPASLERKRHNAEEARDIALVPKDMFDITPDIEVYDNKVTIASWREKLGIIIESAEIAHAMKKVFELAFAQAKQIERERN
jgi:sugar-specific transcriptional regulator TrmB